MKVTTSAGTTSSNRTCVIREYDMIAPVGTISWNGAPPPPIGSCAPANITPYLGFSSVNIPSTLFGTTAPIQYSTGDNGLKRCGMTYLCSNGSFVDNSGANNCSCVGGSSPDTTSFQCQCPS